MALVDYDRVLAARESGYHAFLLQMLPPNCSPKNHILCGYFGDVDAGGGGTNATARGATGGAHGAAGASSGALLRRAVLC
jgi:hypothetical protein